jgi:Rieske Fe-S protein
MQDSSGKPDDTQDTPSTRRGFFLLSAAMTIVGGAYATLAVMAGRFLYPPGRRQSAWQFVETTDRLRVGESLLYTAPTGAKIVIARQREGDSDDAFIALSSICPHLGCAVHWEPHNSRFFCPCHNGVFDSKGVGTSGPPGEAGQVLPRYPLKVENGLLFIEVPVEQQRSAKAGPSGAGHDDCLQPRLDDGRGELA